MASSAKPPNATHLRQQSEQTRLTLGLPVDTCPHCWGRMKLRALVRDPESIERSLRQQGLWTGYAPVGSLGGDAVRAAGRDREVATRAAWKKLAAVCVPRLSEALGAEP